MSHDGKHDEDALRKMQEKKPFLSDDEQDDDEQDDSSSVWSQDDSGQTQQDEAEEGANNEAVVLPKMVVRPSAREQWSTSRVSVVSVAKRPKAIVLLLGSWNNHHVPPSNESDETIHSAQEQLREWYQEEQECSTVCVMAGVGPVLLSSSSLSVQRPRLTELVVTACREAARLARMAELTDMANGPLPILIHSFGHGGAVLLQTLEHYVSKIATLEEPIITSDDHANHPPDKTYGSFGTTSTSDEGYSDETEYGEDDFGTCVSDGSVSDGVATHSAHPNNRVRRLKFNVPPGEDAMIRRVVVSSHDDIPIHRTDAWRPVELQQYVPRLHPSYQTNHLANHRDVIYVAERTRLGCAVMDSGPHDMTVSDRWHMARRFFFPPTTTAASTKPFHVVWCWMMQLSLILHHVWHWMRETLLGAKQQDPPNHNHNETANNDKKDTFTSGDLEKPLVFLTNHVAFVYSTDDAVCSHESVEAAMERQRSHGSNVTELKLDESGHMQHYQEHDWQYERFVRNLLQELAPVNYEDEEGEA